jgi:hypothetical protein
MSLSAYMQGIYAADHMPSWAQLDWRQAVVNGAAPNALLDGLDANARPLGVMPQWALTVTAAADAEGPLAAGTLYTYGVQRVVKLGGLEIPGAMTLAAVTPSALSNGVVGLVEYEYASEAGALWTVVYRVYRSKAGTPTVLYLVEELEADAYGELATEYTDTTIDELLNAAMTYSTAVPEPNMWVPPCRFVRSWRGRFVLAGSLERAVGPVTIEAGSLSTVLCSLGWLCQASDIGAQLKIAGLPWVYTVAAVDVDENAYTLASAATGPVTAAQAWLFRQDGTVYVTNPQPGNVEGYTAGTEVLRNSGAGESIQGLAVHGAYCYVLHSRGMLLLDTSGTSVVVAPFPGGAPGCVAHATIADGQDAPSMYYYAGRAGVMEVRGTAIRNIGAKIRQTLAERVDHAMDGWSHGVYDAQRGLYLLWVFGLGGVHEEGVRIPELCLVWDAAAEEWYEWELAAVASAVWPSAAGGSVTILGLLDGLAVLDEDTAQDCVALSGTVAAGGEFPPGEWLPAAPGVFPTTGLVGLPLHFEDLEGAVYRFVIISHDADELAVAGMIWPKPAAGWKWRIGSVRFAAETGVLGMNIPQEARVERVLWLHEPTVAEQVVRVALLGVRHRAEQEIERVHDLVESGEVDIAGGLLGLRGRGFRLKIEGDGTEQVTLAQVLVETSEVARHERRGDQ